MKPIQFTCTRCGYVASTDTLTERLAAIYAAAQENQPDEGKHELAVRIMRLAKGEQG